MMAQQAAMPLVTPAETRAFQEQLAKVAFLERRVRELELRLRYVESEMTRLRAITLPPSPEILGENVLVLPATVTTSWKLVPPEVPTEVKEVNLSSSGRLREISLKKLPFRQVLRMVRNYVEENPGSWTSDIILALEIEPDSVIKALKRLEREQVVEGRRPHSTA